MYYNARQRYLGSTLTQKCCINLNVLTYILTYWNRVFFAFFDMKSTVSFNIIIPLPHHAMLRSITTNMEDSALYRRSPALCKQPYAKCPNSFDEHCRKKTKSSSATPSILHSCSKILANSLVLNLTD